MKLASTGNVRFCKFLLIKISNVRLCRCFYVLSIKVTNIRLCKILFVFLVTVTNIRHCNSFYLIGLIIASGRTVTVKWWQTYCNSNLNVQNCNANWKPQHTVCIQHCTVSWTKLTVQLTVRFNSRWRVYWRNGKFYVYNGIFKFYFYLIYSP